MTKIWCCLCSRRTDKNSERKNIGLPSVWPTFELHALKIGLEIAKFSKDDFVCLKCYSIISHYRMTDRGPNKKVKMYEPVVFAPIIKKDVLRGYSSEKRNSVTVGTAEVSGMFV